MISRATGPIENLDYWPLGNVSDDGSCLSKANSTVCPLGKLSTRGLVHSGSGPLGQEGPQKCILIIQQPRGGHYVIYIPIST